jgi:branched-chain amino acid transport system ATP-binding protein
MKPTSHPGSAALETKGVILQIGGLRILDDVDLRVEPGERRVILGPNGAGKTTLFNAMTGVLRPTAGSMRLQGRDMTRWGVSRRASAGLARTFQITNLMHSMTVHENVMLALLAHRRTIRRDALRPLSGHRSVQRDASRLLEMWDLESGADRPVHLLSYGERRELEIVLAVAAEPSVLLLDEPTAGLSPAETAKVAGLVTNLSRDVSLIVIEHDMDIAMALADTVTVMVDGRVWVTGNASSKELTRAIEDVYMAKAGQTGGDHAGS